MKLLLALALSLFSLTSFSQTVLWPEGLPCVKVGGYKIGGKYDEGVSQYNWFGRQFKEIEGYVAELQGMPADQVKLSFNYLQYRFGYDVLAHAQYSADCMNFEQDDEQLQEIKRKSAAGTLTIDDFKGPQFLHVVQPLDKDEVNCLAISKINGKLQGCNDIWQGGLQENELVCFKGKTYPKCHVECIQKIYKRELELTPGSCKAGE